MRERELGLLEWHNLIISVLCVLILDMLITITRIQLSVSFLTRPKEAFPSLVAAAV